MEIILNAESKEITSRSIAGLLEELSLDSKGIAIGLNNRVIPRSEWESAELNEGDSIVIVSAVFGG